MSIFLPAQLGHDRPHALPHGADAGALGVDAALARAHRHLRAVPRFAGDGDDFDVAGGDLGDFALEELAHQAGVGAREVDLDTLGPAGDLGDEIGRAHV